MREVIFVVLPQVEILDLAGPLQAFNEANVSRQRYRIRVCATKERVETHHGVVLADLEPLPQDIAPETLVIVPGMPYARTLKLESAVVRWITRAARAGAHMTSVCTGAFILGEAGLLDGRRCTTHWMRIRELAQRYPRARVLDDRLFVSDGNVTTSAGIASGIDMALAIIEQNDGPTVAAEVAREMVVYLRRDGSQGQLSVYLDYRTHVHPGVHRVQDWIVRNPAERTTLEALGGIAAMSPRSLTRAFREATGISVHDFQTRVRIELAKTLMSDPSLSMEAIAQRCGFTSARHLRRYGLTRR